MGVPKMIVSPEGAEILEKGSPEFTFMTFIPNWFPGIGEEVLRIRLGDDLYKKGFEIAMANGWIIVVPVDGIFRTPRLVLKEDRVRNLLRCVDEGIKISEEDMRMLRQRKLVKLILV